MSLLRICIYYLPAESAVDLLDLSKQLTAKRSKEELFCDKTILDVSENILM